jgi:hypothetical protein
VKNKGLTYGLIVVVGVVWYQVFMRVKSNFDAEEFVPQRTMEGVYARKIVKPEAFKLQADYRDPFSGSLAGATVESPPANTNLPATPVVSMPKPKPEPVYVQWPSIRYYGLVRKTTSASARTLVAIDGSFYKVREGEHVLDNIYIQKVTRDYVVVKYQKETKTFNKVE